MVEDGTAIDVLPLLLLHGPGTGFGLEDALIALAGQLGEKVVVVLVCLHLLWKGGEGREGRRGGAGGEERGGTNKLFTYLDNVYIQHV